MTAASDDNFHQGSLQQNKPQKNTQNSHSLGNISVLGGALKPVPQTNSIITDDQFLMRKKSRSREAINLGPHGLPISCGNGIGDKLLPGDDTGGKSDSEVIFTTARPATIISSFNSAAEMNAAEKNNNNVLHIKEDLTRMSPRRTTVNGAAANVKRKSADTTNIMQQPLPLLPDSKEVDWTTLVDRAIMQVNEGLKHSQSKHNFYEEIGAHGLVNNNNNTGMMATGSSSSNESCGSEISTSLSPSSSSGESTGVQSMVASASLPELQTQVSQLEDRISKETRRRKSLEHAVRRLSEENRRLQDESQAAVQQLRRFTEWFFQTIDRQ